ncbi:uncharacterized protein LOC141906800 isoform X4 [Tubulanus polymorphus]|uniref:uncharacterized protein LOC141906800 isoform X4 n=1 Tax=Tubulanus polymorphus TaxID=672921 RepID=UPI003DA1CE15
MYHSNKANSDVGTMGRKLDLSHLSEEECESILQVIQRDFALREKEKERIQKSQTELITENEKRKLLSASSKFNENCCIRCCATFGLFFNRKRVCHGCRFNVCSNCSEPDKHDKLFICTICVKQRDLLTQSCDWFYTDVNKRFKRFGSAKVVRSLHKRESDSASDCGGYKHTYSDRPRPTVQGLFESIHMNTAVALDGNDSPEDHLLNAKNSQLQRYQHELMDVRGQIEKLLASNTTENGHSAINAENLVLVPLKIRISNALRNLAQGLYMAHNTGDEEFNDNEVNKQVQEAVIEVVETYVGEKINLPVDEFDELTSSDDGSVVESIPESHTSQAPVQDSLAQAIVVKIINDYNEAEDAKIAKIKEEEAIRELEELALFSQEIQSHVQITKPVVKEVIEEVNSDDEKDSAEEEEIVPLSVEREQYMRTPTEFFDKNEIVSNNYNQEPPSPNFGPHPNFVQTQLLGKSSPLPSFEPSPLGYDEIDFDNFSSLKFGTSDINGEEHLGDNGDEDIDGEFKANNWLLKGTMGDEEYKMDTSSSGFKITMPQFSHRASPMVGNREVDELSDLTSVGADDLTDDDEGGDNDTVASLSSVEELEEETEHCDKNLRKSAELPVTSSESNSSQTVDMDVKNDNVNIDDDNSVSAGVERTENKTAFDEKTGVLNNVIIKAVENVVVSQDVCTDPVFDRLPVDISVPEGEMMRFSCQVSGTSPIDVFWYRDGGKDIDQLEDNDKYDIYRHGNDFYLDVYDTCEKDAGGYLCIGINEQGQCSHTVQGRVTANLLDKHKPEFIKSLEDVEVIEGQTAKFFVKVKGYPIAKVTWYKDGKKIKANDEKFKMIKIGNRHHELVISCAMIEEDAEYAVIASNVVGKAKTYAQLIVEPAPQQQAESPKRPMSLPIASSTLNSSTSEVNKLDSLSYKVTKTRSNVTNTAENVLTSAQKISDIDRDLDEMENRLDNMETNVMSTNAVLKNNRYLDDDDDSIEDILARYTEKKKAAANIRAVTSTAMDVLADAEPTTVKETPRFSTPVVQAIIKSDKTNVSTGQYNLNQVNSNNNYITEDTTADENEVQLTNYRSVSSSPPPIPALNENPTTSLQPESVTESQYSQPLSIEIDNAAYHKPQEQRLKPNVHKLAPNIPSNDNDGDMLIDCGLKRVDSKRYKRDYHINRAAVAEKKNSNINPPPPHQQDTNEVVKNVTEKLENFVCETEDEPSQAAVSSPAACEEDENQKYVYMVAGDMFSLEEKIKKLESKINDVGDDTSPEVIAALEEEVARAVAQVSQSEKRVAHIESHVGDLNNIVSNPAFQSQYSFNSEADSVADSGLSTGATTPVDLMSPRSSLEQSSPISYPSSVNEENVPLPSVKRLSAIFDSAPALPSPKSAHCKRVMSLTARTPILLPSSSPGSPVVRRNHLKPDTARQRPKSDNYETLSPASSANERKRSSLHSAIKKEASPRSLLSQNPRTFSLPATPTNSHIVYQSPKPLLPSPQSPTTDNAKLKGQRSGNILARAAFWDSRINECVTSDHDIQSFPVMDDENVDLL